MSSRRGVRYRKTYALSNYRGTLPPYNLLQVVVLSPNVECLRNVYKVLMQVEKLHVQNIRREPAYAIQMK